MTQQKLQNTKPRVMIILHTTLRLGKNIVTVILVYLSINDKEINTRIKGEIGVVIDQSDEERCVFILNDLN